jgi:hypothetical protein
MEVVDHFVNIKKPSVIFSIVHPSFDSLRLNPSGFFYPWNTKRISHAIRSTCESHMG